MHSASSLYRSDIPGLRLRNRGKVRDLYDIDDEHLLIVATDRLSAFDVVFEQPIPGKGEVLSRVSRMWFGRTAHLLPNQLAALPLADVVPDAAQRAILGDRATVVRRLQPLPIEAIVRGYLIGSGWKDYQDTGAVCGIELPMGLQLASRLPQAIFTPSSKAAAGEHDVNIDMAEVERLIGRELARQVAEMSLRIYTEAARFALARGIIIADTKFEFGLDQQGQLHLIDEVLTPDSSRFWPATTYQPGSSPASYDKQFVRDYLEQLNWNKRPPAPSLPEHIITQTAEKYAEAERLLTGEATQ